MFNGEYLKLNIELDECAFDLLEVIQLKRKSCPIVESDLTYPDGICIHSFKLLDSLKFDVDIFHRKEIKAYVVRVTFGGVFTVRKVVTVTTNLEPPLKIVPYY